MHATLSPPAGLTEAEAATRLARHGRNRLAEPPRRPAWRLLLDQFRNLLVAILLVGAVLAALVGDLKDAGVIGVVLVANAVLGFVQEHRAERSLAALRAMVTPTATVRRDGATRRIPAEELVPGDLVLLEAGDRVPADGQLVLAAGLEIDESSLTGESLPVAKTTEPDPPGAPLAERPGTAHMNTVVTRGRGELVVAATGMQTEIGRLAGLLAGIEEGQTPLQRQLAVLAKRLAAVAGVAVATYLALGLARGDSLDKAVLHAVALAVAAVPEGLPAVVTVTLALGVHRLARRGAIVKRLASVETLGSTTVICSDKTGTLTQNRMAARVLVLGGRRFDVTGDGYAGEGTVVAVDGGRAPTAEELAPLALCNDSHVVDGALVGDPTEGALAAVPRRLGIDPDALRAAQPRLAEVPFDPARRFMATWHPGAVHLKGALDAVLDRCSAVRTPDGDLALDRLLRADLEDDAARLAGDGLRVLAVATAARAEPPAGDPLDDLHDLVLVAVVGLLDPPRPEAAAAVATCRRAGIDVKVITGDHAATAAAVARAIGIDGAVRPGADLDGLDDDEVVELVRRTAVFARVAPEHKVRIVQALQRDGEVVAMTGDGVNDAPALKQADIGIAMGITGTEVSKEASDVVLTDDDFATIVKAVEGGRSIYDNLVKFVRFQLATNVGAILALVGAQLVGLAAPFTALQILWVNLIMDGPPAMALGVDPPATGTMQRAPRRLGAAILTRGRLGTVLLSGSVAAAGTLGLLAWWGDGAEAATMAFTAFVLCQLANVFNTRSETGSVFTRESLRNRPLLAAVGGAALLQVLAVQLGPLQGVFDTVGLGALEWAVCLAVAAAVVAAEEARKAVVRRRAA